MDRANFARGFVRPAISRSYLATLCGQMTVNEQEAIVLKPELLRFLCCHNSLVTLIPGSPVESLQLLDRVKESLTFFPMFAVNQIHGGSMFCRLQEHVQLQQGGEQTTPCTVQLCFFTTSYLLNQWNVRNDLRWNACSNADPACTFPSVESLTYFENGALVRGSSFMDNYIRLFDKSSPYELASCHRGPLLEAVYSFSRPKRQHLGTNWDL